MHQSSEPRAKRVRLPSQDARTIVFTVRVSPDERVALERFMREEGFRSLGASVRSAALAAARSGRFGISPKDREVLASLSFQLRRQGGLLNQLVRRLHLIHRGDSEPPPTVAEVNSLSATLRRLSDDARSRLRSLEGSDA